MYHTKFNPIYTLLDKLQHGPSSFAPAIMNVYLVSSFTRKQLFNRNSPEYSNRQVLVVLDLVSLYSFLLLFWKKQTGVLRL